MKIVYCIIFLTITLLTSAQITDTINFDNHFPFSNNNVISIDSMDGVWQVGKPNKTLFTQSLSLPNSAVTDTINSYSINNDSYLYFHIDDWASYLLTGYDCDGFINFDFKCNLDSLNDYVQLEIYSFGQWDTLVSFDYYEMHTVGWDYNHYVPTEINYHPTFTGTEYNWQHVRLAFSHWALFAPVDLQRGNSNHGQFRFHFHSDGIFDSKDGFMIDNLVFENYQTICVGSVSEENNTVNVSVYPSLTSNQISFESESEHFSNITIYDFSGKLIDNFNFSKTNFKSLELSNLSNGMYFYSVEDGKAVGKFVIEK